MKEMSKQPLDLAVAPASDNGGDRGAGIGNPAVLRDDDCAGSGTLRSHSGAVTSSDIAQERARETATLDRLDSTPVTARKTDLPIKKTATSASATQPAASYLIVDLDLVNQLLGFTLCKTCGRDVKRATGDRNYGLATKLALLCKCSKCLKDDSSCLNGTATTSVEAHDANG
ncbi:hypothetical protein HPB52_002829 [Rhipicephalus sanguineus]|uniref:Uncharacterized protein n=1 Tax=Rhipicephalus sanguineus TaxID=34632 RepID=A0A9D4PG52_RHISA|nr:hypothetical protein HPB52_002829 [Rhipicephalus sanguineus]